MMKDYELLCILPGTLAEDEVAPTVAQISSLITDLGGEIVETKDMGKSRLSYPMKHIRYGYFELFTLRMSAEAATELTQKLRLMTGILRVILRAYSVAVRQAKEAAIGRMLSRAGMQHGAERPVETEEKEEEVEEEVKKPAPAPKVTEERGKVDMAEIDKKLDELLDNTLENV